MTKIEEMVAEAFPCDCAEAWYRDPGQHRPNCAANHRPAALALAEAVVEMCEKKAETSKGYPTAESERIRSLAKD